MFEYYTLTQAGPSYLLDYKMDFNQMDFNLKGIERERWVNGF